MSHSLVCVVDVAGLFVATDDVVKVDVWDVVDKGKEGHAEDYFYLRTKVCLILPMHTD